MKILSAHLEHEQYVTANVRVTSAAHVSTILLYLYAPICLKFMSWKTVFFTFSSLAVAVLVIFVIALGLCASHGADSGQCKKYTSFVTENDKE